MKTLARKCTRFLQCLPLFLRSIKMLYRYGGYSTVRVANLHCGEILKGKNVLITGGSRGIGFSIAQKCVQEGAKTVITGRSIQALDQAMGKINSPLLKTLVWDVSRISRREEGVAQTKELLGGDIDVLVNNAGIANGTPFPDVTEEIWDEMYATNSKGLFFLTQAVCANWMTQGNDRIKKVINISSQGGFVGATYPYRLTKWDIAGLTQGLGIQLAPHGIIVNGIAPGIVATDMQPGFLEQKENFYCALNPLKRVALPDEIASLAVFLMSDAANFIVGQTIVCDGGFSLK